MRCPSLNELPPAPSGKTGWPWTEESPQVPDAMPDGKPWPKISIITPSYNQGRFIEETIRSVLLQGYSNLEYIIIDGGSTDNSVEIIKKYEPWLAYWVAEPDRGQSHAINKGFKDATGDLLAWLNSDDYYMPGTLCKISEAARVNPEAGGFVGIGRTVDFSGEVTYYKEPPSEITVESTYNWMSGGNFMQPSCFFTKSVWDRCGPLDENIHMAFDVDLWLRMTKTACRFVVINDLLSTTLGHKDAKTKAFKNLMRVDIALAVIRHGGEHAVSKHLEEMAQRLSWYEANFWLIMDNPLVKLLVPVVRLFLKPILKRQDTIPTWLNRE